MNTLLFQDKLNWLKVMNNISLFTVAGGRGRGRASSVEFVFGVDAGNHDHRQVLRAVSGTMHLGIPTDASLPFLVKKIDSDENPQKYSTLQV